MTSSRSPTDLSGADDVALDWLIRQRAPDFNAWEAFTAWLEADPGHAKAFEALASADRDMTALLATARPRVAPRRPRRAWLGGAVAASLAVVAGYTAYDRRAEPFVVETAAGEVRTMMLAGGTRLDLNGGTRLRLDHNRPREASLDRGEVLFTVAHDADRPFRVIVGDATLVDVGTVFNVTRDGGTTSVGVAEGAVIYNPGVEAVRLVAGRSLRVTDGAAQLVLADATPASIGGWRGGRLVYDGALLSEVAADLSRNLGLAVVADPAVARQRFRGVINLGGDRTRTVAGLGPLLDVRVRREGPRWVLGVKAP